MTRAEAIKILKDINSSITILKENNVQATRITSVLDMYSAFSMAIEALKECEEHDRTFARNEE